MEAEDASLRIFVNYRRDETTFPAHQLYDALAEHFGEEHVFIDVDTIEFGVDFAEVIEQEVSRCDVLLAVIGKGWLTLADDQGRRRLDNPDDYVRLEITAALRRKDVRVVPILVQGASPPPSQELPEDLRKLARLNALPPSDDWRWVDDVNRLIRLLNRLAEQQAQAQAEHQREEAVRAENRRRREEADRAGFASPESISVTTVPTSIRTAPGISTVTVDPSSISIIASWRNIGEVARSPSSLIFATLPRRSFTPQAYAEGLGGDGARVRLPVTFARSANDSTR